jgi:ascorbate-specific PTS system EIIC-type component UlaA
LFLPVEVEVVVLLGIKLIVARAGNANAGAASKILPGAGS